MSGVKRVLLLAAACLISVTAGAQEDLARARPWLPQDINALAIVRVERIMDSGLSRREHWNEPGGGNFLAGAVEFPPGVKTFLRGTQVHPGHRGDSWSVAILEFARPVDMDRLAARENASVQTVAGRPAVASPRNAFFALLDQNRLGVVSPAHRQNLSRWLTRGGQGDGMTASPYLNGLLQNADDSIVLAIDLADMFDPDRTRERLSAATVILENPGQLDATASLLMTLHGLRLGIDVGESVEGTLSLDFNGPVTVNADLLRSLVLEVLSDLGAGLDGFDAGKAEIRGQSLVLTAALSDEDLRRVMSLVTTPHPSAHETPAPPAAEVQAPATSAPGPRVSLEASRRYLKAVDQVITDLQRANRRAKEYLRTATWHDNFARKIEQLPTVAVDPELVQYGDWVASQLRGLAASLRGVAVDVDTQQRALTWNATFDPGWETTGWWTWGYRPPSYNVTSNLAEVRQRQAEAVTAGAQGRDQIWLMITEEQTKITRRMEEKFGPEFQRPGAAPRR
ncbi:MAG: hypothetical protein KF774_16440 [Planctomyces sp.]|nr:hypothetical protein [Planctomyces sp.]